LAIVFPISAFVAMSFEHSIANMYFIPAGILINQFDPAFVAGLTLDVTNLTLAGFLNNLIPVTIGNIMGGVILVAASYWFIYLRKAAAEPKAEDSVHAKEYVSAAIQVDPDRQPVGHSH
jgi:formate/nitrite transporter FocA (FNT family)